jgi:hypothetical protein
MSKDIESVNDIQRSFFSIGDSLDTEFVEEASMEEIDEQIKKEFSSEIDDKDLKSKSTDLMESVQQEVDTINTKKEEIENALTTARIKDSNFLEKEIKGLILSSKRVLETLEKDIKIGAPPRMYEVYATMLNAITGQYKELRNLNESIAKFIIENKKQNLEEVKEDHKLILNSNDALDMYMKAKEDSQMDGIEAEFNVIDDDEIKRE